MFWMHLHWQREEHEKGRKDKEHKIIKESQIIVQQGCE